MDVLTFKLGFYTFGREKLFCKDKQKRVSWPVGQQNTADDFHLGFRIPIKEFSSIRPIVNIEPAEGGVLRIPEPLLAAEPVGTANNLIDDFLSCDPNLDFLYKILCYSSPPRASEPLNIQNKKEGKEEERKENNGEKDEGRKMEQREMMEESKMNEGTRTYLKLYDISQIEFTVPVKKKIWRAPVKKYFDVHIWMKTKF